VVRLAGSHTARPTRTTLAETINSTSTVSRPRVSGGRHIGHSIHAHRADLIDASGTLIAPLHRW
jgi:hypothetical protein